MTKPTDSDAFRAVMGRFASGVTVVSTEHGGSVHGMTANAFLSVSLEPALVLVSVDHRAKMYELLEQTGSYGVSMLSAEQQTHSDHFAGRETGLEPEFEVLGGVPVLRGALAQLTTRVVDAHRAGDHTLFIGEVQQLVYAEGAPLLYFQGKYGRLSTS